MWEVSRFVIGDVLQKSLSIYVRNLPAVAAAATVGLGTVAPVALAALGSRWRFALMVTIPLPGLAGFVWLALLVPITILTLAWWVAVPVASVERRDVCASAWSAVTNSPADTKAGSLEFAC